MDRLVICRAVPSGRANEALPGGHGMKRPPRNIAASVRSRLKGWHERRNVPFRRSFSDTSKKDCYAVSQSQSMPMISVLKGGLLIAEADQGLCARRAAIRSSVAANRSAEPSPMTVTLLAKPNVESTMSQLLPCGLWQSDTLDTCRRCLSELGILRCPSTTMPCI